MKKYKVNIKYNIDIDKSVRYDRTLKEGITQQQLFITIVTPFTDEITSDEKIYIKDNILNILSLYLGKIDIYDNTIFMELRLLNDFNSQIDEPIILYNVQKDYPIIYNDYLNKFLDEPEPEPVASSNTDIQITEFGNDYISNINNETNIITFSAESVTVDNLLNSITTTDAVDINNQTYTVYFGETIVTDKNTILSPDNSLEVIAEDEVSNNRYTFSFG